MLPLHETDFYIASDQISAFGTTLTVALVGVIGLPALLATALHRRRDAVLRAREAIAAETGADTRVLRPGKTVVHGEVLGDRATPCISIRIEQFGREYTVKTGKRHKWTETGRVIDATPFTLRLASGATIRVEPGEDVLLVDWLGIEARPQTTQRARVAELRPHSAVYVEGELVAPRPGDAYRGGDATFTLRRGRDAPVLISVERLEQRHEDRARRHAGGAACLVAAFVLTNVVLFGSFWRASALGRVEMGDVARMRTWTTTNKGRHTTHYGVAASFPKDGPAATIAEISWSAYQETNAALLADGHAQLPFVVIPGSNTLWVGLQPTIHVFALIVAWMAILLLPFGYVAWMRHHRPWYERTKVVDDGEGPLGAADQLE